MQEQIAGLLEDLKSQKIKFTDVIAFIEGQYIHTPTAFKNGETYNETTQNQGSAKVLYFAKLHELSVADTLQLFAEHYQSVLGTPDAADHQNIRQFMANGWNAVVFEGVALHPS